MSRRWYWASACHWLAARDLLPACAAQTAREPACATERDSTSANAARIRRRRRAIAPSQPYAGEPRDLSPYAKFAAPYDLNYIHPNIYTGAAAILPEPKNLTEVRIGFFGPIEHNPDQVYRPAHAARRAAGHRRGQRARRLRRQAIPPHAPQRLRQLAGQGRLWRRSAHRPNHLGLALERSRQDDLRRRGLGDLRLHQFRIHAHYSACRSQGRDSDRQFRFYRSHDSRDLHSLVLYRSAGRSRAVPTRWRAASTPSSASSALRCCASTTATAALACPSSAMPRGGSAIRSSSSRSFLPGDTDFTRAAAGSFRIRAPTPSCFGPMKFRPADILKQMRALGMKQRVFGSYRTLGPELLAEAGPCRRRIRSGFSLRPHAQRSTLARLQSPLRSALP